VRAVPVRIVRKEDNGRLVLGQYRSNDVDRCLPPERAVSSGFDVDVLETLRRGLHQLEAEIVARVLQLGESRGLSDLVAPLRDRNIDHAHAGFAHQTQCQPADDALIVGMGRKDQRRRRVRCDRRLRWNGKSTKWKTATFSD
jgi:hypothetical protein